MSIRKFFNDKAKAAGKKARVLTASALLMLGAAGGGYIGHDIAIDQSQPQISQFTLAQLSENTTEEQFMRGDIPADAVADPLRTERMAELRQSMTDILSHRTADGQKTAAVDFVNNLRLAENLSEQDYKTLVDEFDKRIGMDVTDVTGNYRDGIMYWQDAQVVQAFAFFFDDEDMTNLERSREIGDIMSLGQDYHDTAGMAGALGGAALGSIFLLPFWMRRRREDENVKLPLPPEMEGHNDNTLPTPKLQRKNGPQV